jgi:uncharacterized membrane protein
MRSRLSLLGGHPVHVMIVPFAMAPFALLVVFDALAFLGTDVADVVALAIASFGLAASLAAILTGLVDLAAIPDGSRAHTVAAVHFAGGIAIAVLYAASAGLVFWRGLSPGDTGLLAVNLVGTLAVGGQGWLGGELVTRHRIGVLEDEEGADPTQLEDLF